MTRILEVELYILDQSGCPLGTKRKEVSATRESDVWIIQRIKPEKNEKKGKGGFSKASHN